MEHNETFSVFVGTTLPAGILWILALLLDRRAVYAQLARTSKTSAWPCKSLNILLNVARLVGFVLLMYGLLTLWFVYAMPWLRETFDVFLMACSTAIVLMSCLMCAMGLLAACIANYQQVSQTIDDHYVGQLLPSVMEKLLRNKVMPTRPSFRVRRLARACLRRQGVDLRMGCLYQMARAMEMDAGGVTTPYSWAARSICLLFRSNRSPLTDQMLLDAEELLPVLMSAHQLVWRIATDTQRRLVFGKMAPYANSKSVQALLAYADTPAVRKETFSSLMNLLQNEGMPQATAARFEGCRKSFTIELIFSLLREESHSNASQTTEVS